MMIDLLSGIIDFLANDTGDAAVAWRTATGASTGNAKLYSGTGPEGINEPYATYIPIGGSSEGVFGAVHDRPTIQFTFWGKTTLQCLQLQNAFDDCFNRLEANIDGNTTGIAVSRRDTVSRLVQDPDEDTFALHVDYNFYIG